MREERFQVGVHGVQHVPFGSCGAVHIGIEVEVLRFPCGIAEDNLFVKRSKPRLNGCEARHRSPTQFAAALGSRRENLLCARVNHCRVDGAGCLYLSERSGIWRHLRLCRAVLPDRKRNAWGLQSRRLWRHLSRRRHPRAGFMNRGVFGPDGRDVVGVVFVSGLLNPHRLRQRDLSS